MKFRRKITFKEGCVLTIMIYLLLAAAFYYIGGEQLKYNDISTQMSDVETTVGEITKDYIIEQTFTVKTDSLKSLTFIAATYARKNTGELIVELLDKKENKLLSKSIIDVSKLVDNKEYMIQFKKLIHMKGKELALRIQSPTATQGNAVTIYYNSKGYEKGQTLTINNKKVNGELCISTKGRNVNVFGTYYIYFVLSGLILLGMYCLNIINKYKKGMNSFVIIFIDVYNKYRFLIKQLVLRDFKTKYKRSMLGFMWSFLNPLLTMVIQYVVFSTIFRSNIENFPVYLLTGSIIFNFFTESVGVGLISIVVNAPLITKVYVPKYIYPVTRVLSTAINLLISLLPLLFAIIITGENITKAYLLLPFILICLTIFCIGMSFILSSAMVFFRDTQFLWGIVSLLWMYATPLFYPESIIPERFSIVFKVNPMYYFIKFTRTIILDGVSPQPIMYFYCIFFAVIIFIFGAFVFKKSQDKFILYL